MIHRIKSSGLILALAVLLASSCSNDEPAGDSASVICIDTADCSKSSKSTGYLCISGVCSPCESNKECNGTGYYGPKSVCKLPDGRCSTTSAGAAGVAGAFNGIGGKAGSTFIDAGGRAGRGTAGEVHGAAAGGGATSSLAGGGATTAGTSGTGGALATGGGATPAGGGATTAGTSGTGGALATGGGATPAGGGAANTIGGRDATGGHADTAVAGGSSAGVPVSVAGAAGAPPQCSAGSAYNPAIGSCVTCGFVCPLVIGETNRIYPLTRSVGLNSGQCICETKEGYFYNESSGEGTTPCDADNDGWVRDSAIASIESNDPAIKANARCTVRQISSVVLRNEKQQELELYFTDAAGTLDVSLTAPVAEKIDKLPLYESVRNDGEDQPAVGRNLGASELNSFTKACVSATADYNHNSKADIEEWARLPSTQIEVPTIVDKRDPYLELYTRFSYFAELYRAWYQDGKYYIEERARSSSSDPFGLTAADPSKDETWRTCDRKRDANFPLTTSADAVTYDFASVSPDGLVPTGWDGMLHHSQFKCMLMIEPTTYGNLTAEQKQGDFYKQTVATLLPEWQVNECVLGGTLHSAALDKTNPKTPSLTCIRGTASLGQARWVSTHYQAYRDSPSKYVRGCVNECVEKPPPQCWDCTPGDYGMSAKKLTPAGSPSTKSMPACNLVCDGSGNCGDCVPGTQQCKDSSILQACEIDRQWHDLATACEFGCNILGKSCNPQCRPTARQCRTSAQPEICDSSGHWQDDSACPVTDECVGAGICLKLNGQPCTEPAECVSNTCTTFYHDGDGDGDGDAGTPQKLCGVDPPAGWSRTQDDCCDSDRNTHRGQTEFYAAINGCGSFDFDCDGTTTKQYTHVLSCADFRQTGLPAVSWYQDVPECGVAGTSSRWIIVCCPNCSGTEPAGTITQACR